jgi:hypothetical protein
VEIMAGTNALPGWYGIESVDTAYNTWTFDRACTTGASSNIKAYYCPTLVRSHGIGNVVRGIHFTGTLQNEDRNFGRVGTIGWHIVTSNVTLSAGVPTGTLSFENCTFSEFDTGILMGRNLAKAYSSASGSWVGSDDNHADTLRLRNCLFSRVKSAVHVRNLQSVGHVCNALYVSGLNGYVFNMDAGGKVEASGVGVAGTTGPQCLLRLGRETRKENNPYAIRGFEFDGGTATRNPQYVVTAWEGLQKEGMVVIDTGCMNRTTGSHDSLPLIDVQSRARVVVKNVGLSAHTAAFWPGSIRIREGASGWKPIITIENCCLNYATDPNELLHEDSNAGTVKLINCWKHDGTELADTTLTP